MAHLKKKTNYKKLRVPTLLKSFDFECNYKKLLDRTLLELFDFIIQQTLALVHTSFDRVNGFAVNGFCLSKLAEIFYMIGNCRSLVTVTQPTHSPVVSEN